MKTQLALIFSLLRFGVILGIQKTFQTIHLRPEDFNALKVIHEATSEDLCHFNCLLAESDCQAYTFKNSTNECIFGDFTGIDDPIYLASGEGLRVNVDVANPLPVKSPHIAIFGGTAINNIDISLYDGTSTTSPWFPDWPGPASAWNPVGTFIEDGFLVCGGAGSVACRHLKLGSDTWKDIDDIPGSTGGIVYNPAAIALGCNTFWVHGGYESGTGIFDLSRIYFSGKWTESIGMTSPVQFDRHCLARIDHKRVSAF